MKTFDTADFTFRLLGDILALRAEVGDAGRFIADCAGKLDEFKRSIPGRYPGEMVEARALHLLCYLELKAKLGQARAYEIMRAVFLSEGIIRMNLEFDTLHGRSFEKLTKKVVEFSRGLGLPFEVVQDSPDRFELRIGKCWFWELCCELGIPEATTLACQVDNAFFSSYLPDEVRFSHGTPCSRLVDGAEACHLVFTRTLGVVGKEPVCPG